jgi:SAM-dependent methyltransferase
MITAASGRVQSSIVPAMQDHRTSPGRDPDVDPVADPRADPRADPHADPELPEHVRLNREAWDRYAADYAEPGRRSWARAEPEWGIWGVPESELRLLPGDLDGKDAIDLGCGTGYWCAWLARRGARVVGIDNSPRQLENARRYQAEFGLEFPLVLGSAETVPYPEGSFDFAMSEYGAALWADPYAWIPEASRLLRPGGRLVFLTNGLLMQLAVEERVADDPAKERLQRPLFGMHRTVWPDDTSVEFHLPHGEWIRLLRDNGFEVERLAELQAPPDAVDSSKHGYVTADWARKWPSEEAWVARKRG